MLIDYANIVVPIYRPRFIVSKILAKETSVTISVYLDSISIRAEIFRLINRVHIVHYEIHNSSHFLSRRETGARNKRQKIIPFRWQRLIEPWPGSALLLIPRSRRYYWIPQNYGRLRISLEGFVTPVDPPRYCSS